jgi:HEAT repeat protein
MEAMMEGIQRHAARRWVWALAAVVLLAGVGTVGIVMSRAKKTPVKAVQQANSSITERSSLASIARAVADGDGMALAVLQQRINTPGATRVAIAPEESPEWIRAAQSLVQGYSHFAPYGRTTAALAALRIMERYSAEPAPTDWSDCLQPVYQVVTAALADADPSVRTRAVQELARFWKWAPGRELTTTGEVDYIADWKESVYTQVVRALADKDGSVRARAVAALSALPLDAKAAPAAALINDENFEVRLYVLAGFANRRDLLDEESIVRLLYDTNPAVAMQAENVLKTRGLTSDQIGLCKMVVHPLARMRTSVIPLLQARTDIDPTIWLVFLSRDRDEAVQLEAVKALAQMTDDTARERLTELARDTKASADVRRTAQQSLDRAAEAGATVALPPLPGSPSLNPRAN